MTTQTVTAAVARREENTRDINTYIVRLVPEIQRALPPGLDANRIARLAMTVVRRDPKLAMCTPESFAGSLMMSSALGLEPGVNGEAYLVAYGNECTLIVGFQGFAKLFYQHPMAKHVDAQAVYANDEFDYAYGTDPFLRHKPATGDRGQIIAYYSVATLTSGASAFVVLSPDEVKKLRGGKVGPSGSIADPMHWMERKTAFRQLVKMLPKSTTLQRAMAADEKGGHELYREQIGERQAPALPPAPDGIDAVTGELEDVPRHEFVYADSSDNCATCGELADADVHGGRA